MPQCPHTLQEVFHCKCGHDRHRDTPASKPATWHWDVDFCKQCRPEVMAALNAASRDRKLTQPVLAAFGFGEDSIRRREP